MKEELLQAFRAANRFGLAEKNLQAILDTGGAKQWVDRQLNVPPGSIKLPTFVTDGELKGKAPVREMQRQMYRKFYYQRLQFMKESKHPVLDRLAMFWSNHFTVSRLNAALARMMVPFEFEAIRPHLLGKFEDLCFAATTHIAMLIYLNNTTNIGPNSPWAKKRPESNININENHARELLELHTVGRNGPYTQADIVQLALLMTGWGMYNAQNTVARFIEDRHEPGTKTVLGKVYGNPGAGGELELRQVIADLARQPATAKFIALKLCRYMVSNQLKEDNPLVVAVANAFLQSGGDLLVTYRALFNHSAAWEALPYGRRNLRLPDDWLVALTRLFEMGDLNAETNPVANLMERYQHGGSFGQPYARAPGPDGWPQNAATWITSDAVFNRGRFAVELGGLIQPDMQQEAAAFESISSIVENFLPLPRTENTASIIEQAESVQQAMSLTILAPEFQRRA